MAETVLIADGKGSRRRRLKTLLSALGYRVLAAGSGAEALALAETARLRVVLMAARLPDMPAESLLRAIRERNRDATRLILCEGPGEISGLKHAADGFLLPPLHADALEVILRGACEREALRRRLREQPMRIERRLEKRFRQRLETERLLVVKQIVDKISTFIGRIARDVEGGVRYFNEMPYFVSIHDRQARVLAASRPYRMLLGAHAGDGSGSIYEGESGESGGCPVGRTLATANAQQSREVVRYRSGAKVPVIVHTAPIYNDNGEVELVLEVSAGTQDVKRLREDTQNTQQRYQLLFDAVPCYLAVLDRSLVFSANNRAFITEFSNRTGTAFRDVFYMDDEAFLDSPVHKTLTDAQSRHGEMTLVGPNGRRYHLLVWTSPISTAAGKLMQVLLIFLDITQIRELQSNLASLGLMIGSISHSIKGVLTGLDAGVYLLDKGFQKKDDAQIESGLDVVRRMVNRMRKMILDILFCARERELQRTTVDVQTFADDVVEIVQPKFDGKGIRLECDFKGLPASFEVDADMLRSAVVNVLENAVDACVAQGLYREPRAVLRIEAGDDTVDITVEDNGIGMSAEQLQNLFTIFFSTKGSQGTGLGLFLTDRIIRQHGGQIVVESRSGHGSRFRMTLPRQAGGKAQKV
jgi:signal transduction histidine kinase/DNA-binding NarL/FixJ family response regulator